jgi:hypothetical protein
VIINFIDFLIELSVNPRMSTDFALDPDRVLNETGLSPEEKTILRSRDPKEIRGYMVKGLGIEEKYASDDYVEVIVP